MPGLMVLSPMTGWVSPLDEVPDPVFAERILGDGVAVDPTSSRLNAPCDGVIAVLARHAVTVRADNGAEILVHVGLETVALNGQGFTSLAHEGQRVKAGDGLLEFDLGYLGGHARSLLSPVIIANGDRFKIARRSQNHLVTSGDFLMEVVPLAATAGADTTAANLVSRIVVIALEHGLHARPAALVANAAKRFAGDVTLSYRGKSANAKSAVAIMALGVRFNDDVTVTAAAREAVDVLAALLQLSTHQGATKLAPAPPPQTLPANTAAQIHGIAAAPGRVLGRVVRLRSDDIAVPEEGTSPEHETAEFQRALAAIRARLERASASGDRAKREILSAHIALLEDAELLRATTALIAQGKSAGFAWRRAVRSFAETFRSMSDVRMRERAADMLDLERQVISVLTSAPAHCVLPPSAILIAEEILPSDLTDTVAGFVSAGGGATSHAAILAAGMNIPALVGAGPAVLKIADGTDVLLNADEGVLDLRPDPKTAAAVHQAAKLSAGRQARDLARSAEDCFTADRIRIEVFANLGKGADEAAAAVRLGAEGCGVLRTEFLFMERATPPDEEEQHTAYQAIADALGDRSFILRTFDIGADKPVPYLTFPPEDNPQLGLRGVRAAQVWPELLRTQLKAAVRVKPFGHCKIMVPMITAVNELVAIRAILDELCKEEGTPPIALGAMIETPSAALLADQLVCEADFLSIGTNDLTQYVLAIDRGHRQLSSQLDALHPAVLRLIARTAEAANAAGKTAAVCGGLAADLIAAPLLIGLGISELSVPAPVIPRLKSAVRKLNRDACRAAAQEALTLSSASAVRTFVKSRFGREVAS